MRVELSSFSMEDIASIKASLGEWQSPDEFVGCVSEAFEKVTPSEIFNIPALAFLRDAWTLGQFAKLSCCDSVQLAAPLEQFPDGRVRVKSETHEIEVTEALMPDRRRGEEFAPGAPAMRDDPGSEWDRRLDALPSVLERTILRKAKKAYSIKPYLVVYLNISAYHHRDEEMRAAISEIKIKYCPEFSGLYILWQGELI